MNAFCASESAAFWVSGSALVTAPLPNGVGIEAPISIRPVINVGGLVVDGAELYWSTRTGLTVNTCRLPACIDARVLAISVGEPSDLAVDATAVYWVTGNAYLENQEAVPGTVWKLAR